MLVLSELFIKGDTSIRLKNVCKFKGMNNHFFRCVIGSQVFMYLAYGIPHKWKLSITIEDNTEFIDNNTANFDYVPRINDPPIENIVKYASFIGKDNLVLYSLRLLENGSKCDASYIQRIVRYVKH